MTRNKKISADISKDAKAMLDAYSEKHERSRGWLLDKMIRSYCAPSEPEKKETAPRSKPKTYPSNLDEQFAMLWDIKGKKGSKKNAYNKFKALSESVTDDVCEKFTTMLIDDILKRQHEIGVAEQHLITYLNKEEWDR